MKPTQKNYKKTMNPCRICKNPICLSDQSPCDELEAVLPSMYDGASYMVKEVNENTPSSAASATVFQDSERKLEFEEEFDHQASKAGFETKPLISATAKSQSDWDRLKDLVEKAISGPKPPTKKLATQSKANAHRRSAQFAIYMRCWTVRDIAKASNQARQTIHDQLSATLRECAAVLVAELGLPPGKYKKTKSIKEFKDIFNQGTYR